MWFGMRVDCYRVQAQKIEVGKKANETFANRTWFGDHIVNHGRYGRGAACCVRVRLRSESRVFVIRFSGFCLETINN